MTSKFKFIAIFLVILGFLTILFAQTNIFNDSQIQRNLNSSPNPSNPQSPPINQVLSQIISDDSTQKQSVLITKIIDGDTIETEGGQRVRLIGIDTPESTKSLECFAREATDKTRELLEGKGVFLVKDISETDRYRRLLRYVYLPAEASAKAGVDDLFVNEFLVKEGYAYASSYPPDIKYQQQLIQAQSDARKNNRGLWASCQSPLQSSQPSLQSDCPIKGNISSSGEKIYHLPGQRYYEKTVIDESRGERWFCSEEEAQKALWRKSKI